MEHGDRRERPDGAWQDRGDAEGGRGDPRVRQPHRVQFALLQPAASRLDVGIKLPGIAPAGRLEASCSFNAMVSHLMRVGSVAEVDAQLVTWLREAYGRAG